MYFERFPKGSYILPGTTTYKQVVDLFRRIKIKDKIKNEASLYSEYFVTNGERPEQIAHKHFGSTELHWVVLITNNITDAYYGWPMSYADFENFIKDKYTNPDAIHHHEKPQTSGDTDIMIECMSTDAGAVSVSNREYEQRIQDDISEIKLMDQSYLSAFLEEFDKLMEE